MLAYTRNDQPKALHGECVAVGMVIETEAGRALGTCDPALAHRVQEVCALYGLPTRMEAVCALAGRSHPPAQALLLAAMAVDKKNKGAAGGPPAAHCVLLRDVGEVALTPRGAYTWPVPTALLARLVARCVMVSPAALPPGGFAVAGAGDGPERSDARAAVSVAVPGSKSMSNRMLRTYRALALGSGFEWWRRLGGRQWHCPTFVLHCALWCCAHCALQSWPRFVKALWSWRGFWCRKTRRFVLVFLVATFCRTACSLLAL
jgi:hypothetical protein